MIATFVYMNGEEYQKGDQVEIIDDDFMLQPDFVVGQKCTYVMSYGQDIHALQGKYRLHDTMLKMGIEPTDLVQSVHGHCFKKVQE